MKWLFRAKSKLRILIDTKCDLSGYETVSIWARKPDGNVVNFPAVVKDVENGIIFYDVVDENDIDLKGWWIIWPEVIFDDDRNAAGRAVKVFVHEAGSL